MVARMDSLARLPQVTKLSNNRLSSSSQPELGKLAGGVGTHIGSVGGAQDT